MRIKSSPSYTFFMDQPPNLRKLAAMSLNRSCKQFLGNDSQCDLMAMKFERGEITFNEYLNELEGVFQHHTPVEEHKVPKESGENVLKKPLEKENDEKKGV